MDQPSGFPHRRPAGRLILQLLLVALAANAAVALADVQRMLIESQSFSVPAGGTAEPRAMCLDASSDSPSPVTRFARAPKNLGDIRVTLPGGQQMSLQAAIDKHVVEIRGTQGYSAVQFRNLLSSGEIKVDVRHNSVVMPDSSYRTADLKGLPELQATRLESQSALWESRSQQEVVVTGTRIAAPAARTAPAQHSAPAQPPQAEAAPPQQR